jgi:CRP-like cAMP-binding protein
MVKFAEALITKLAVSNKLDDGDIHALHGLNIREKLLGPRVTIVSDGTRPTESCLLVKGYVFRIKMTPDGGKQVLSIHIPGEVPDLQSLHLKVMDHDLETVTDCTLGFIAHDDLKNVTRQRPNLAAALWRETLIDGAIFREWIVNVGQREALPRMAHLLLEMHERLKGIGLTRNSGFELPVTQTDLSDCLGLSAVHTNRVLQELRREKLISVNRGEFRILDLSRMKELAGFDAAYLHLGPTI